MHPNLKRILEEQIFKINTYKEPNEILNHILNYEKQEKRNRL